jgi:hypothetical protein
VLLKSDEENEMTASKNKDVDAGFVEAIGSFASPVEYMVDAAQRTVLFWDALRQRGNQYHQHLAETVPHVLDYKA